MKTEEWYTEDECKRIIESDAVVDSAFLYKHLNLAFQKGSQIGSGQTRAELGLVSAELERVKAERPNVGELNQAKSERQTALTELGKALAELSSLKSRLPVNADGDVVLWGDEQFYIDSTDDSAVNSFAVEEIVREGKTFGFLSMDDVLHMPSDCHSTAESCRAAAEGGGE